MAVPKRKKSKMRIRMRKEILSKEQRMKAQFRNK